MASSVFFFFSTQTNRSAQAAVNFIFYFFIFYCYFILFFQHLFNLRLPVATVLRIDGLHATQQNTSIRCRDCPNLFFLFVAALSMHENV